MFLAVLCASMLLAQATASSGLFPEDELRGELALYYPALSAQQREIAIAKLRTLHGRLTDDAQRDELVGSFRSRVRAFRSSVERAEAYAKSLRRDLPEGLDLPQSLFCVPADLANRESAAHLGEKLSGLEESYGAPRPSDAERRAMEEQFKVLLVSVREILLERITGRYAVGTVDRDMARELNALRDFLFAPRRGFYRLFTPEEIQQTLGELRDAASKLPCVDASSESDAEYATGGGDAAGNPTPAHTAFSTLFQAFMVAASQHQYPQHTRTSTVYQQACFEIVKWSSGVHREVTGRKNEWLRSRREETATTKREDPPAVHPARTGTVPETTRSEPAREPFSGNSPCIVSMAVLVAVALVLVMLTRRS